MQEKWILFRIVFLCSISCSPISRIPNIHFRWCDYRFEVKITSSSLTVCYYFFLTNNDVYLPEFSCLDMSGGHRRITLSTLLRAPHKTPSHVKYPLTMVRKQVVSIFFHTHLLVKRTPHVRSWVVLAVVVSVCGSGVVAWRLVVRTDVQVARVDRCFRKLQLASHFCHEFISGRQHFRFRFVSR